MCVYACEYFAHTLSMVMLCIDRLQSENSLLKGEIDSLTQQNKQQLQGLNQVQELATMLQESHR